MRDTAIRVNLGQTTQGQVSSQKQRSQEESFL